MRDKDIQDALDYTIDYHDPSPKCAEHLDNLAEAYRQKCKEYNRLLEVANGLNRSLCGYVDHDIHNDDWYDAEKQVNRFYEIKEE